MITVTQKGRFRKLSHYLDRSKNVDVLRIAQFYAEQGLEYLRQATPKDSGKTADSWYYQIEQSDGKTRIIYSNSNIQNGVSVAILLQYGHATGTGGYVEGHDYINPVVEQIFEDVKNNVWREMTRLV